MRSAQSQALVSQKLVTQKVRSALAGIVLAAAIGQFFYSSKPSQAQESVYCQLPPEEIARKANLLQSALKGNQDARKRYRTLLAEHAKRLRRCRSQTWPKNQGLWLRLYPCDIRDGALDDLMDRIVNRGYSQVNVEVFYNGQVLLPAADNPTAWPSVVQVKDQGDFDLLAQAIRKGHERGLKVYAWMFSMNFGYTYSLRPDRQQAVARNGQGQTSTAANINPGLSVEMGLVNPDEAFIDPYSPQARQDYSQLVEAVLKRRPDGLLFDYIRYPKGIGAASIASKVQDLWVYGSAAQQALFGRALNNKGLELIRRFLSRGYITAADVVQVDKQYPTEREPLWQGRSPSTAKGRLPPASQRQSQLQAELWQLVVAHALQGVVDFLANAIAPVERRGLAAGAVFFPEGNQVVGRGYDSRLQPWHRFPSSIEWHPMAYGVCGNVNCIVSQVQRVISQAPAGTQVEPVLAGIWQQSVSNRPPLEAQMQAIRQVAPQIRSLSHFAYSWQEPQSDRDRKFCKI